MGTQLEPAQPEISKLLWESTEELKSKPWERRADIGTDGSELPQDSLILPLALPSLWFWASLFPLFSIPDWLQCIHNSLLFFFLSLASGETKTLRKSSVRTTPGPYPQSLDPLVAMDHHPIIGPAWVNDLPSDQLLRLVGWVHAPALHLLWRP